MCYQEKFLIDVEIMNNCPNCNAKITDGILSSNEILSVEQTKFINEFNSSLVQHFCNKCGDQLYQIARIRFAKKRNKLATDIAKNKKKLLLLIPIVTIQSPLNWDYSVCGMVTAQSTTGTGIVSEIASSFTDLFGAQSGAYNEKLKNGEDLCQSILRERAYQLGANAIIATDIDYAEVGGAKGMLMVCMSGTAVYVKNLTEITTQDFSELMTDISEKQSELDELNALANSLRIDLSTY
jgi:uncharacterized protein YbjQ (UPF0145 family)